MIDMADQKYVAPNMPVDELPEGFAYMGELTEKQANGTGLERCKMYVLTELDSIPNFYLYQECGTPIDENTVDSERNSMGICSMDKSKSRIIQTFARFRRGFGQCQDVHRIGSAALELAYTACGRQVHICRSIEHFLRSWQETGILL